MGKSSHGNTNNSVLCLGLCERGQGGGEGGFSARMGRGLCWRRARWTEGAGRSAQLLTLVKAAAPWEKERGEKTRSSSEIVPRGRAGGRERTVPVT